MERYWDSLNKAAILVTLFTGIPAFLIFINLRFAAAIALGFLSVSSLAFAFIRSKYLSLRIKNADKFHKIESALFQRVNTLILTFNQRSDIDKKEIGYIFQESLYALKNLAKELCGCEARISLFTIDQNLCAIPLFSSSPIFVRSWDLNTSSLFAKIFKGSHDFIVVHVDKHFKNKYIDSDSSHLKYLWKTIVALPIYSKPQIEGIVETWAGFLSLDLDKEKKYSSRFESKITKIFSHVLPNTLFVRDFYFGNCKARLFFKELSAISMASNHPHNLDHRSCIQPAVSKQILSRFLPLYLWHISAGKQLIFQAGRPSLLNIERFI